MYSGAKRRVSSQSLSDSFWSRKCCGAILEHFNLILEIVQSEINSSHSGYTKGKSCSDHRWKCGNRQRCA